MIEEIPPTFSIQPPMMSTTDLLYNAWGIGGSLLYYGINIILIAGLAWIRWKIYQQEKIKESGN